MLIEVDISCQSASFITQQVKINHLSPFSGMNDFLQRVSLVLTLKRRPYLNEPGSLSVSDAGVGVEATDE